MVQARSSFVMMLTKKAAIAFIVVVGCLLPGSAQQGAGDIYGQLKYRFIGPVGNRISAVVGISGNPNVYYVGGASGGVFKTTDAGGHWEAIFDGQAAASIGAIAIAGSDPNIVWVGTGESCVRSNISVGNGIYKSTDAGKSWTHMGLEQTGRISRVQIHPTNPDIVYVAALGHLYGPQPDRGVFRTTDGGKTWQKVLFVDENTGASDLAMDPNNPRILFAGMWQMEIRTWAQNSGGPGSGVFASRDGGTTWKRLSGHGLPDPPMGKIAVSIAPSNSNRVYALIETVEGGLWRSDDGGENWSLVNEDHMVSQRWHYYTHLTVTPDDENEIYFVHFRLGRSHDGGATFETVPGRLGDNHSMWIDPKQPNRLIIGNDGGVAISVNRLQTFWKPLMPNAQMYHVATDNQIPYNVFGNQQDGPSTRGPSNSRLSSGIIPIGLWHSVGGCETGFAIPDPADNQIIWANCYQGQLDVYNERTQTKRSVHVWPDWAMGSPAADVKYRFQWTFPIVISPHDHNKVYAGSQHVHETNDAGRSWKAISPDLTGNDKSKQGPSGGLTWENVDVEYFPTIFAMAESPLEKGLLWVGTNDGLVQVSRDGGARWVNVTANIPNLPALGTVSNIEPSRFDAGTAYITVDLHQVNNRDPFVYKTTDYGKTWKSISSDIPKSVFSYAHCVREDPVRKGLLYVGTENAIYVSFNDGANWVPLQSNLPHAPVHWLTIQEHFSDLVVGTYGRGFWILDDITPVRQLTPQVLNSSVHLFTPRPAYRFLTITEPRSQPDDPAAGQNAPYGAPINYYLKTPPSGAVSISILDEQGNVVRTIPGPKEPGINRVYWDLRHEPAREPKLRTTPPEHPHVKLGPQQWRPLVTRPMWKVGPLAAPGTYTVQLRVGNQTLREKLTVRRDPNSQATEADVQAESKVALELRNNLSTVTDLIDEIEIVRRQLQDLGPLVETNKAAAAVKAAAVELDKKFAAVAGELYQLQLTGASADDTLRWPVQLYAKVSQLGMWVDGSDGAPTTQQLEVHEMYKKTLATARRDLEALLKKDLAVFNQLLQEHGITNILARTTT